jgi:hypothetical protein
MAAGPAIVIAIRPVPAATPIAVAAVMTFAARMPPMPSEVALAVAVSAIAVVARGIAAIAFPVASIIGHGRCAQHTETKNRCQERCCQSRSHSLSFSNCLAPHLAANEVIGNSGCAREPHVKRRLGSAASYGGDHQGEMAQDCALPQ